MAEIKYDYPLKYPPGWAATSQNARSQQNSFPRSLTLDDAVRFLAEEIQALNPSAATVYSSYQHLANDRLRKKIAADSGIAVLLKVAGQPFHFACDKWYLPEHNLYALHLALRAARNLEDWGVTSKAMALGAFTPGGQPAKPSMATEISGLAGWMQALGLGPTATLEDANAVYRRRAKLLIDDQDALIALNNAIDEARQHLK